MLIQPKNRIFCEFIEEKSKKGILLSDSQNQLDKYSLAVVKISSDKEYTEGMKVIIPSFADKFETDDTKYVVVHSSDIIAIVK